MSQSLRRAGEAAKAALSGAGSVEEFHAALASAVKNDHTETGPVSKQLWIAVFGFDPDARKGAKAAVEEEDEDEV